MPDFATNLSTMFTDLPFLERFEAAARCGFGAVELAFPYAYPKEEVAERLHERRLTLVAFNLPAGRSEEGGHGIACHPDLMAEFREGVQQAIDYAAAVDCRFLNCLAGTRPHGASDDTIRQTLVENLRFAARQAQSIGHYPRRAGRYADASRQLSAQHGGRDLIAQRSRGPQCVAAVRRLPYVCDGRADCFHHRP
jgi:hydroxypyruvate isomerase